MKRLFTILILLVFAQSLLSKEEKNSINFDNLSIGEFIKISSKILNKNIIITEQIEGDIDFVSNSSISNGELLEILESTLDTKGYEIINQKNLLKIVKKKNKGELKKTDEDSFIEIINLHNSDAKAVLPIIQSIFNNKSYNNSDIKPFITLDTHSNSLVIRANKYDIKQINDLVKKLDRHQMQVYVEAKIIELSENKTKDLGVRYGLSSVDASSSNIFTLGANLGGVVNALDPATSSLFTLSTNTLSSAIALGATLSLLKDNQVIDIVSEPSVLCVNNKVSTIYVGETRSFQTAENVTDGGNISNSFQREDIGLTLKVKPRISTQNRVILEIETILEDAKELRFEQINPDTTKKEIKTTAIVGNAESVILGGLIKTKSDMHNSQVPLLGDIPLLGELFKYEKKVDDKINLVVIVTPYIIPKSKDLTFIREQLTSLKQLEENYAKKLKQKLEENLEISIKNSEEKEVIAKKNNLDHTNFSNYYEGN